MTHEEVAQLKPEQIQKLVELKDLVLDEMKKSCKRRQYGLKDWEYEILCKAFEAVDEPQPPRYGPYFPK